MKQILSSESVHPNLSFVKPTGVYVARNTATPKRPCMVSAIPLRVHFDGEGMASSLPVSLRIMSRRHRFARPSFDWVFTCVGRAIRGRGRPLMTPACAPTGDTVGHRALKRLVCPSHLWAISAYCICGDRYHAGPALNDLLIGRAIHPPPVLTKAGNRGVDQSPSATPAARARARRAR